jgi:hypothetical protein
MATHKPDGDGAPWTQKIRIMIMVVVMVMVMVMMVVSMAMAIIILGVGLGDVFVNCDRWFGRWWTRRFLPVPAVVGGIRRLKLNYIMLDNDLRLTVKIVPSARPSSSSQLSVSVISLARFAAPTLTSASCPSRFIR